MELQLLTDLTNRLENRLERIEKMLLKIVTPGEALERRRAYERMRAKRYRERRQLEEKLRRSDRMRGIERAKIK